MPGIYQLSCDSCDYAVSGLMSQTSVVKEDGSELVCPHPGERRTAEEATHKTWAELVREERIAYRYALTCLSCGELNYYGPRDLGSNRVGGHISGIVHQPSVADAAKYTCKACGLNGQLYPLCGPTGCLLAVMELIGFHRKRVKCPQCRTGRLSVKMIGIS